MLDTLTCPADQTPMLAQSRADERDLYYCPSCHKLWKLREKTGVCSKCGTAYERERGLCPKGGTHFD